MEVYSSDKLTGTLSLKWWIQLLAMSLTGQTWAHQSVPGWPIACHHDLSFVGVRLPTNKVWCMHGKLITLDTRKQSKSRLSRPYIYIPIYTRELVTTMLRWQLVTTRNRLSGYVSPLFKQFVCLFFFSFFFYTSWQVQVNLMYIGTE